MMEKKPENKQEILISLSDLIFILKKGRKKIYWGMAIFAFLVGAVAITRPVKYIADGTFKDKGKKQHGMGTPSLSALLEGFNTTENNEATAVMQSRRVLAPIITKFGMQASISPKQMSFPTISIMKTNLRAEIAYWRNRRAPLYPSSAKPIVCQDILYTDEVPTTYVVTFDGKNQFEIRDLKKKLIGNGFLGHPIRIGNTTQFTLCVPNGIQSPKGEYYLSFTPMSDLAKGLEKAIRIESDKNDKSLLKIKFTDSERERSSQFLNAVMEEYQVYLKDESDKVSNNQMEYLYKREDVAAKKLEELFVDFAASLSSAYTGTGFPDSEREMDFFGASQQEFKKRLLSIELESKRLHSLQGNEHVFYDAYSNAGDAHIINSIFTEIRKLKQQRDSLGLALRNVQQSKDLSQEKSFTLNLAELEGLQYGSEQLKGLIANLEKRPLLEAIHSDEPIAKDNHLLVGAWLERLSNAQDAVKKASGETVAAKTEECKQCRKNFADYLNNQVRVFEVYQKMVAERLLHQQNLGDEFQGMNLLSAEELYREFIRQINEIQGQIRRYNFSLEEMQHPDFEISSLGVVLQDQVSRDAIAKAGQLAYDSKDQANRTPKEIERLKEELALQKRFLGLHIQHVNKLHSLSEELLREKLEMLQSVSLDLINQQVTILENHLDDFIQTRLANLKQEKQLIERKVNDLQIEMAALPKKWISEQMLKQRLRLNQNIMEEVVRLVEAKNISHNLESIQSAPLDFSVPPLLPKPPRLLIFTVLGAILGAFFSIAALVTKTIIRGVEASKENLELANQHVSGSLTVHCSRGEEDKVLDSDLETLRRLLVYFSEADKESSKPNKLDPIAIVKGAGPDYSVCFAQLATKRKMKTVILEISFNGGSSLSQAPGLLQYLEGEVSFPSIQHGKHYDFISAGGFSRHSTEMIGSPLFKKLLAKLTEQYDCVLAVCYALPVSAEAEQLLSIFQNIAVTLSEETLQELNPYIRCAYEVPPRRKVSFLKLES